MVEQWKREGRREKARAGVSSNDDEARLPGQGGSAKRKVDNDCSSRTATAEKLRRCGVQGTSISHVNFFTLKSKSMSPEKAKVSL